MLAAIQGAFASKQGLLIGRFGTIELESLLAGKEVTSYMMEVLERNAGVFPSELWSVQRWYEETQQAVRDADVLATEWYAPLRVEEQLLLKSWSWKGIQIALRDLEPYYKKPEERWSRLLAGKRVAVVTSFTETARKQVQKKNIWTSQESLWPSSTEWSWVQTGYAPCLALGRAGWEGSPEFWSEAVGSVVESVIASKAEVALIGCGGLGMIIGAALKKAGIVSIVMGGAIQVFFGIKGERWANHEIIRNFWNDQWTWPSLDETPGGANDVEKSCYWRAGERPKSL